MTYRGIGCPRAPVQLFRESIVALGPASFRPTSSVAKLSALGDDSTPDCLLAGIRQSPSSNPRAHTALEDKEKLAHPIRFERVTFAFGGQAPNNPAVHRRPKLKGWASTWMSHDGFHEKIGGETRFGGSSNGGFWPRKVENPLSF